MSFKIHSALHFYYIKMDIANKVSSVLTSPYETAREFINEITNEIKTSTSPATSQKVIKVIKAFIKNKKNQPS